MTNERTDALACEIRRAELQIETIKEQIANSLEWMADDIKRAQFALKESGHLSLHFLRSSSLNDLPRLEAELHCGLATLKMLKHLAKDLG